MGVELASFKKLLRERRRLASFFAVLLVALLSWSAYSLLRPNRTRYFTAKVEQGDIVSVVQATGTINAVTTVQVGSQVSGQIAALAADFNSRVKKGELIAQIEPAPFRARVLQAEADLASAQAGVKSMEADLAVAQANLEKARAALREAELNQRRTEELFQQGIASAQQREAIQVAWETEEANVQAARAQISQTQARLEQQRAQVKQREAQLEQARLDLSHTFIYAPIDGTVIARNVDVGQTVAASLQAPTLFTIAQDLTQMLVYAKTDEADVGRIQVGAEVAFEVDSFPQETFHGSLSQVRMNAYQVENVVTYDAIIEFENPDLRLLPGMTAYVTIPVASARDVVKIPNGALRYQPDLSEADRMALLAQYGLAPKAAGSGGRSGTVEANERDQRGGLGRRSPSGGQARGAGLQPGERARIVWKLRADQSLEPVRVKVGLTDLAFTHMLEGALQPGDELVIGQSTQRPTESSPLRRMPRRF